MRKVKAPKKWVLNTTGVKCDREGCGYRKDVARADIESYLNEVCPQCGDPLLTIEDWNTMVFLNNTLRNPIIRFINWIGQKAGIPLRRIRVHFNGTGKFTLDAVE
jgi:hypothetical protein